MAPVLTYCTNIFPAETLAQARAALEKFFVALRAPGRERLNLGLYVSAKAAQELADAETMSQFESHLNALNISVVTLNAFPYGNFHGERVLENVFRPTWEEAARYEYTKTVCQYLARWLPRGVVGSVSTHTGTFKEFGVSEEGDERIRRAWLRVAVDLAHLEEETGKQIVLSVEPEPLSRLETTDEVLLFFEKLMTQTLRRSSVEWSVNGGWLERAARRHLGVCFDVCHQAVEFEDCVTSIARLRAAGIPIGKIQASCAPALARPAPASTDEHAPPLGAAAFERLSQFAEPRYLHQTFARKPDGTILRKRNLPEALADQAFWNSATELRTHFHVPIHLANLGGGLGTTQAELLRVLKACADATPCVEIETYTLPAMDGFRERESAILETIAKEREFANAALSGP